MFSQNQQRKKPRQYPKVGDNVRRKNIKGMKQVQRDIGPTMKIARVLVIPSPFG